MFVIKQFFMKQYQKAFQTNYQLDVRIPPSQILSQLDKCKHPSQIKNLIKIISKNTNNGMRILRTLSIIHLLLLYSNSFFPILANTLPLTNKASDLWLQKQIIVPYTVFLMKCCSSRQMYCQNKQLISWDISFERMFYLINLLNQLFRCVKKMSMLGRYYKDEYPYVTFSFVEMMAIQSQKLYGNFKTILAQMILQPKKYIATKQNQILLKSVLSQSLIQINQQMKKLFLDKYFYPYGRGIGIKLFRIQEQNQSCSKIISSILNDHIDTERQHQKQQLEKNLFPSDGQFNAIFYEKSLLHTFIKSKDYEQQAADQPPIAITQQQQDSQIYQ